MIHMSCSGCYMKIQLKRPFSGRIGSPIFMKKNVSILKVLSSTYCVQISLRFCFLTNKDLFCCSFKVTHVQGGFFFFFGRPVHILLVKTLNVFLRDTYKFHFDTLDMFQGGFFPFTTPSFDVRHESKYC